MKKIFLLLAAASIVMSSCSRDIELNKNEGNPISFNTEIGTKATGSVTTSSLGYFYSTALNEGGQFYFNNLAFEKQTSGCFTSDPEYYWPGDGSTLRFFCYASNALVENGKLNPVKEGENYMIKDYAPGTDVALQKDFVYGYTEGSRTNEIEEHGLPLTMRHGLTQISLKAKNTNEGYTYKITGVRVGNFIGSGDFRFPTNLSNPGGWITTGKAKEKYEVDYSGSPITLSAEVQNIMGAAGNVIVVPQALTAWNRNNINDDGSYLAVKVKITTIAGADVFDGWAATPIATAPGTPLEQGMIYSYILDFSEGAGYSYPDGTEILGGPIKFTTEVVAWANHDYPPIVM